jgi:hypothetical protein
MTVRQLTVQQAQITTATVEIKTLSVSGKQVTLAVFRQLLEEDLIDSDGMLPTLRGTPWGMVNYHPEKCSEDSRHRHVVWQLGDELRRAYVSDVREPSWLRSRNANTTDVYALGCALRVIEGDAVTVEAARDYYQQTRRVVVGGAVGDPGVWWVWVSRETASGFEKLERARDLISGRIVEVGERYGQTYWGAVHGKSVYGLDGARVWLDEFLAGLRRNIDYLPWRTLVKEAMDSKSVLAVYRQIHRESEAYAREYQRLIDEICKLDQLFIAV